MTRAHVFVYGKVQGVFFRLETSVQAHTLGVTGWVTNLQDGRVEAVFEGHKDAILGMINFCKHGSSRAEVRKVEVQWAAYTGEYKAFEVL